MAVSGLLLLLLIPVLSLCGATEYYVRPTEPTNTSCPAQPCLTLSQYTNDSDHYFKSNTVFKFLPGTHHMDRPVTIGNIHNMSWESLSDESEEHPHLVAEVSCGMKVHDCVHLYWYDYTVCCAAVWFHDMYNVTVKGIRVTVQRSNEPISAVILKNVSSTIIQLNAECSLTDHESFGIAIHEATSVEVHSSSVHNCTYGLVLLNTTSTHITKVTAMYNELVGIVIEKSTDTHINSTIAAYNVYRGVVLLTVSDTHMSNVTLSHNRWEGMHADTMNNTCITNMTTVYNGEDGMQLFTLSNTNISYLTMAHNGDNGMILVGMNNTYVTNMISKGNAGNGIFLSDMTNTYITNVVTKHNDLDGMGMEYVNNTHITNMTATCNQNGMEFLTTRNTYITNTTTSHNVYFGMCLSDTHNTHITKTTSTHNGKNSYPTSGTCCGQIVITSSTHTLIHHTSFADVSAPSTANTGDPTSLPAVIALYNSTLNISGCDYTGNSISAVRAYASNVTVSGHLTFSGNSAFAGTAFILIYDSILTTTENSHIYFLNNHATNTGGVFYITNKNMYMITSDSKYYKRSTCFLNTEGSRLQTRFTFANNSAEKGGDILYGGQVAFGLDGEQNCLDSFKNISNTTQNTLSPISSDPSRACLCNERGRPDCLLTVDPTPLTVYPGQTINISAVVVGQDFGTVAGSVYAQFLQRGSPPQLESGQGVQSVTQHDCNNLYYTIFSQSEVSEAVLILTAYDNFVSEFNDIDYNAIINDWMFYYKTHAIEPLMYSNNPVYVNISLLSCPLGFMLTTHSPFKCDCDALLQEMQGIKCDIQDQTIGRSGLLWVGMIQDDNGTNGTIAASEYCPLNYCTIEGSNVTLSEPDSQCNYNHSGTLCGGCQPGLSLALGSAQCLQCSNKYLALLIPLTLAGPVLVFSIKLLDLTISQGTLNGLIFYANIIKANEYIFLPRGQTNPLTIFIAWLNLDLGVETCFFQGLSAYSKTWLQFMFPFYIWIIAGFIIVLARYSDRVAKAMGNNSVPVLATLFLLSYAKLLRTIITALSYTMVYTSHGPKVVWTADGNVDYLGPQHAPLFVTAMVVLLFLWLPYTLLLFLGQWLRRCNCRLIVRMLMKIKPFLDAHYGPLKSKHHYWLGALLLVRATILLISALVPANRSSIVVLSISVSAVVLAQFGHLVYRNLAVAMFNIAFFMNLVLLTGSYSFTTIAGGGLTVSTYTLIGIAFVQFVGLVLFKAFSILKGREKVMGCLHKGQPVEDDWELYEEAALLRQREFDSDNEDSEDSGSIESLPTY